MVSPSDVADLIVLMKNGGSSEGGSFFLRMLCVESSDGALCKGMLESFTSPI